MSKCYALQYIGVGAKRYNPGDLLPELSDSQWKRLARIGAIRTEIDPDEAADEENAQTSAHLEGVAVQQTKGEAEETEEETEETGEETEDDDDGEAVEMPDIDVMDGIAEPEAAPKAKKSRKAAK